MKSLLSTEFELFAFFELTPDLVCIAGKDGFFKKVNPAVINKLGYTEGELYASPISSFIFPEDRELTHELRTELLNGKMLHNFIFNRLSSASNILQVQIFCTSNLPSLLNAKFAMSLCLDWVRQSCITILMQVLQNSVNKLYHSHI